MRTSFWTRGRGGTWRSCGTSGTGRHATLCSKSWTAPAPPWADACCAPGWGSRRGTSSPSTRGWTRGTSWSGGPRGALKPIPDLPRLIGRIGHASASPRDLVALRFSLERLPALREVMAEAVAERLRTLTTQVEDHRDVAELIGRAIVDDPPPAVREGGIIRQGYDPDLDGLRRGGRRGGHWGRP